MHGLMTETDQEKVLCQQSIQISGFYRLPAAAHFHAALQF
jgi:hypothetical protein